MTKPLIELSDCEGCGVCEAACPAVFKQSDLGYMEVIEMEIYPEEEVGDAIRYCPVHCIQVEAEKGDEPPG